MQPLDIQQVQIRALNAPAEAQACAQMMAQSDPWVTLRRTVEDAFKLLTEPAKEVYVASVDRALAGFVVLHLRGPFSGYLQTIAVWPEWRGKGIGRRLIAFAEKRILSESPNVFLCVSSFNTGAQRLYARLGYERVGELKDYIVKGHSEIVMRKTVSPLADYDRLGCQPQSSTPAGH